MTELYDVTAYDKITVEDLENYRTNKKRLNELFRRKAGIERQFTEIKSVDFSKDKVSNGASRKTSLPEFYTIALEEINRNIQEFEGHFLKVDGWYKAQLYRLDNERQREVLTLFFMKLLTTYQIALLIFADEPDLKEKPDYYVSRVKEIKRAGLKNVKKFGAPEVKAYARQLVLKEREIL